MSAYAAKVDEVALGGVERRLRFTFCARPIAEQRRNSLVALESSAGSPPHGGNRGRGRQRQVEASPLYDGRLKPTEVARLRGISTAWLNPIALFAVAPKEHPR